MAVYSLYPLWRKCHYLIKKECITELVLDSVMASVSAEEEQDRESNSVRRRISSCRRYDSLYFKVQYGCYKTIFSTQNQAVKSPALCLCALCNPVDSIMCVAPPKRAEYCFSNYMPRYMAQSLSNWRRRSRDDITNSRVVEEMITAEDKIMAM
jgi:hypothetical protein